MCEGKKMVGMVLLLSVEVQLSLYLREYERNIGGKKKLLKTARGRKNILTNSFTTIEGVLRDCSTCYLLYFLRVTA